MQLQENECKHSGELKKYWYLKTNPIDVKSVNTAEESKTTAETNRATKIRHKKRRNKSKKFKEYFNIQEKVGQVFIAILIISFLYTFGYYLQYLRNASL